MYSVMYLTSMRNSNTPKVHPTEMEAHKYQSDENQCILVEIYGISVMLISYHSYLGDQYSKFNKSCF